jgi:hypothetical protein
MAKVERSTNSSLVLYPENLRTEEGFILGVNLTEFVVVVLDILPFKPSNSVSKLRYLLDQRGIKETVSSLVNVHFR